jgi:cyclophilin family peptidyl-prolyl cis-trans isomerase
MTRLLSGSLVVLVTVAAACTGASPGGAASAVPSAVASLAAPSGGATTACPTSAPAPLTAGETRTVTIGTELGDIVLDVEADLGPRAAGNFVALAECGFYEGTAFHRLVPGFVIQGGDPAGDGTGGPGYAFANDPVTVAYDRGVVAMANAGRDTNGSQFFIVLDDLGDGLPPDYSVFGRVTSGMDVVDALAARPNSGPPDNFALDPVTMDSVTIASR